MSQMNTANIVFKGIDNVSDVIKKIKNENKDLNNSFEQTNSTTSKLIKEMSSKFLAVGAVIASLSVSFNKFSETLDEGMRLRIETEGAEKALAGLIGTFYDFKDSYGNLVDENTKFNLSLRESKKLLKEINNIALKNGVDKKSLSEAVMAGIGASGGNFTNEQVVNVAGKVSAVGGMIGLNDNQLKSELKSILSGNINNNSDIASMLGLKGDELYKEALKAGKGFEYLSEKFKSIDKAVEENGTNVGSYFASLDAYTQKFKEEMSEDYTKSFKDLKFIVNDLTDEFGNFNPQVQAVVDFLNNIGGKLGQTFVNIKTDTYNAFKEIGSFIKENETTFNSFADAVESAFQIVYNIIKEVIDIFTDLFKVFVEIANTIANTLVPSINVSNKEFDGLSAILKTVALGLDFLNLSFTIVSDAISYVINFVKQLIIELQLASQVIMGFFTDTAAAQEALIGKLNELKAENPFSDSVNKAQQIELKYFANPEEVKSQLNDINQYQKTLIQQNNEEELKQKMEMAKQAIDYQKSLIQSESAKLDILNNFSNDKNNTEYYNKKLQYVKDIAKLEIEALNKVLQTEKDVVKQNEIKNSIKQKEADLSNKVLELELKHKDEIKKRNEQAKKDAIAIQKIDLNVEKQRLQNQLDEVARLEEGKVISVNEAHNQRIGILTAIHNLEQAALQNEIALETDKMRIIQLQAQLKMNDMNFNNALLNTQHQFNTAAASGASERIDKQKELNRLINEEKMIRLNNREQNLDLDREEGKIGLKQYYAEKMQLIAEQYKLENEQIQQQLSLSNDAIEQKQLGNELLQKELDYNTRIRELLLEKKNALIDYKDELISIQQELAKSSTGLNNIDLTQQKFDNLKERDLSQFEDEDKEVVANYIRTKLVLEQISQLEENINKLKEHSNILQDEYLRQLQSGEINLNKYNELIKQNGEELKAQIEEQKLALQQLSDENNEIEIKLKVSSVLNNSDETLQQFKEFQNQLISLTDEMKDSFSNTFTEILNGQKSVADGMKEMLNNITNSIFNFIAKRIGEQLFESILGGAGNSSKQSGSGLLGQLGGILTNVLGGSRASGGLVKAGTPYLVGEAGSEIFIPSTNGRILNNSQSNELQTQTSSNIYNNYVIKTRKNDSFNNSQLNSLNDVKQILDESKRNS